MPRGADLWTEAFASEVPKLDVSSAFEEAVCVEGKQLEETWGDLGELGLSQVVVEDCKVNIRHLLFGCSPCRIIFAHVPGASQDSGDKAES